MGRPVLVADGNEKRVDAVLLPVGVELSKNGGHLPVGRGVSDPLFAGRVVGRVDHKLLGVGVVAGRGLQLPHVGPMPPLRHGETARQVQGPGALQEFVVVALGAEAVDAPPKQPKLDPELDNQTEVVVRERLEGHDKFLHVPRSAVRFGVSQRPEALLGQQLTPVQHLLPVGRRVQFGPVLEGRILEERADALPKIGVLAVQQGGHRVNGKRRLRLDGRRRGPLSQQIAHHLLPVDVQRRLDVFEGASGRLREPRAVAPDGCDRHAQLGERAARGDGRFFRALPERADPAEIRRGGGRRLGVQMAADLCSDRLIDPVLRPDPSANRLGLGRSEHPVGPGDVEQWKDGTNLRRRRVEHGGA